MEGTVAAQDEFSRSKDALSSLHCSTGTLAPMHTGTLFFLCLYTVTETSQAQSQWHMHSIQTRPASPTGIHYHPRPDSINQQRVINVCVSGDECWASPVLKVNLSLHLCLSSFLFMYPSDPAKSYIRKLGKVKCSNKSTHFKWEGHHSESRPLILTEYVKLTNECFRHFLSSIFFAELYKCIVVNYFSVIRLMIVVDCDVC